MSENNSYYQVQRVLEIPPLNGISIENVSSAIESVKATLPSLTVKHTEVVRPANNITTSVPQFKSLQSPISLKSILQKQFDQNIASLNQVASLRNDQIVKIKTAAIQTLQKENLKIENKTIVVQAIQKLMSTTTVKAATEELSSVFRTISQQHATVFTNTISAVVQTASIKTGFEQIKSEIISPSLTRIIATNSKGINLVSEIHTDKNNKVDIVSELEGVTDGSCKQYMEQFNGHMADLGVIAERKERKPTGGICQMEYAKNLSKKRNTQKRGFSEEVVIKQTEKQKINQYTK